MSSHSSRNIYAETLAVFDRGDPYEPHTTPEVAAALDANRRTVYKRLQKLVERGELRTKEAGAHARVWWRPVPERSGTEKADSQFRSLVQAVEEYAIFTLDPDGRVVSWNDGAERIKGYERDEIVGEHISTFYTDEAVADGIPERNLADAEAEGSTEDEGWRIRKDGSRFWANVTLSAVRDDRGDLRGYTKVTRDMTERREYERRLERQRDSLRQQLDDVYERIDDAVYALDEEWRFTHANERAERLLGRTEEELVGEVIWEEFPEAVGMNVYRNYHDAMESQESVRFEEYFPPHDRWYEVRAYPSETGLSAHFLDVTDRKERERELEARIRQQDVVADLGQQALQTHDVDALVAEAAELVADTLDNDYCTVLDDADTEELRLRHGVGWDDGAVGSTTVSATETDSQAAYTLASKHPIVVTDLRTDSRFSGSDLLTSHDVRSGISTIVGPDDDPWGVLATHDTARTEFSEQDVNFVQSVANILATAIERHTYERELTRQREHLAALNNLNRVVREITDAVIEQSTREEIERVVCEQLAASESYKFAWVADVDRRTEEILPRAEAGIEAFLENIDLSADPDERIGRGPAGKTFRTGELRVSRDVFQDPAFEPWRHNARKYGFRSFASIPIVHEDTLYGVLGVYSERAGAFAPEERGVIGRLGEVVGHAIAAVEHKQALMSDEIVELAFRARDVFDPLDVSASLEGTITFDRTVPLGDGAFLVYGTATDDAMGAVDALVDAETVPHWDSATVLGVEGDTSDFEVRLTDPPVLPAIAAQGGYIHEATIENGNLYLAIHLAPSADAGRVIDSITEAYPAAEMVTRRQTTRSDQSPNQLRQVLSTRLTRRQQAALEAGYFAGYFEWPRASSGEDVAESLDISSSTFHQHLRKAERKLLDTVFGPS